MPKAIIFLGGWADIYIKKKAAFGSKKPPNHTIILSTT
jgi:hypothetical protein